MNKNEFLAFSLPHKLKVYVKYNHKPDNSELETMVGIVDDCIITDMHEDDMAPLSISNYGLCLRPLSDLTKEIEHNGEKFVPITEIQKRNDFIHILNGSFVIGAQSVYELDELPTWVTQLLIKWHFDIADLISKGEAIDVNTLEINPYK